MAAKAYDFGTYDCFSDIGVCLFTYCCTPCVVCDVAGKINAVDTHGCGPTTYSLCVTAYCPTCAMCCCPDKMWFCHLSTLMDRSMQYHQITVHPDPCKDSRCACCYCQMYWPCTAPCTLCVIARQANKPGPV